MILRVAVFVVAVVAVFVVAFGVIVAVTRRAGGTLAASMFRARDFFVVDRHHVADPGAGIAPSPSPLALILC